MVLVLVVVKERAVLTITKEQDWQKVVKPRIICKTRDS
jgi:hypothetical protein